MNDTLKYRYAALPVHRVPANSRPMGRMTLHWKQTRQKHQQLFAWAHLLACCMLVVACIHGAYAHAERLGPPKWLSIASFWNLTFFPHLRYVSAEMGVASAQPSLTMMNAIIEQKSICVHVNATGYGNPDIDKTYLFTKMTAALRKIHKIMHLCSNVTNTLLMS